MLTTRLGAALVLLTASGAACLAEEPSARTYINRLTKIEKPAPLLADFPQFVQPVEELTRYEAPVLIDDANADLAVRAWRWSYNARGIIEVPNRLSAAKTAVIIVHPWGIDDGQGWRSPEPAGVAFKCTPDKNALVLEHGRDVINPLLKSLRGKVGLVMYSLPGSEDPIRKKIYRGYSSRPTHQERRQGQRELAAALNSFDYRGQSLPAEIKISGKPTVDYFRQFPGLDATARYNHEGFWDLPIPVMKSIEVAPDDVVIYDALGYEALQAFLVKNGIEHVLLGGYSTDMCVCRTTAGYENLREDFNVFLIGDATLATFPANKTPAYATNQAVSYAALNLFITQTSWIKW
jgi:nicotinamidase-related amidase